MEYDSSRVSREELEVALTFDPESVDCGVLGVAVPVMNCLEGSFAGNPLGRWAPAGDSGDRYRSCGRAVPSSPNFVWNAGVNVRYSTRVWDWLRSVRGVVPVELESLRRWDEGRLGFGVCKAEAEVSFVVSGGSLAALDSTRCGLSRVVSDGCVGGVRDLISSAGTLDAKFAVVHHEWGNCVNLGSLAVSGAKPEGGLEAFLLSRGVVVPSSGPD